jgi:hypothetical protein
MPCGMANISLPENVKQNAFILREAGNTPSKGLLFKNHNTNPELIHLMAMIYFSSILIK